MIDFFLFVSIPFTQCQCSSIFCRYLVLQTFFIPTYVNSRLKIPNYIKNITEHINQYLPQKKKKKKF
jgi:hypothetical protein